MELSMGLHLVAYDLQCHAGNVAPHASRPDACSLVTDDDCI